MTRADISKPADEWLETNGHGGIASGTVSGIRTRRYQRKTNHKLNRELQPV
jgi:hypothetical protein